MISINLICCKEKVFILMSALMIGKRLMKQHYLKKKQFIATISKILQMQITWMQKEFVKTVKIKYLGEYYYLYLKSDTLLTAHFSKISE